MIANEDRNGIEVQVSSECLPDEAVKLQDFGHSAAISFGAVPRIRCTYELWVPGGNILRRRAPDSIKFQNYIQKTSSGTLKVKVAAGT